MNPAATPPSAGAKRLAATELLALELARLGRASQPFRIAFSDAEWREAMLAVGCAAWTARLASPTARRSVRGRLGMATICHNRHGHDAVVYVRTHGRTWAEIEETVRHEALHVGRPSYNHRQVEAALHGGPVRPPKRRRRRRQTRR